MQWDGIANIAFQGTRLRNLSTVNIQSTSNYTGMHILTTHIPINLQHFPLLNVELINTPHFAVGYSTCYTLLLQCNGFQTNDGNIVDRDENELGRKTQRCTSP